MSLPELVCGVCGATSHASLITHIIRKHKMKMADYRSQFPSSIVQRSVLSEERRKELGRRHAEWFRTGDTRAYHEKRSFPSEIKHWTNKGMSEAEALVKVSEHQARSGLCQNTPEVKAKKSEISSGVKNPMSLQSISMRYGVTLAEASKLTPAHGRMGSLHPMWGKRHTAETIRKIAAAPHLCNFEFRSKAEKEIANICDTFMPSSKNKQVGKWNCDIVATERKLIIEFFGDFWHANPAKYTADWLNKMCKMTAAQLWARDARKVAELTSLGYTVIVVWESDWKYNKEQIIEDIRNAYDRICPV